jgi:hypothetical protein
MPTPVELSRLHGIEAREITTVNDADGRLQLFARSVGNELFTLAQTSQGGLFAGSWLSLGADVVSTAACARNADGRLAVFVRGTDGTVQHSAKTIANHLSFMPWSSLGGWKSHEPPQAALGPDGLLRVFAHGDESSIWCATQLNPQKDLWSPWRRVTHAIGSRPSLATDGAGRLHLFVRGSNAAVWQYTLERDGSWDQASLGGVIEGAPAAIWNVALGRFEVFARAGNRAIWQTWERKAGVFAPWQQMGFHPMLALGAHGEPIFGVDPQVVANADGRLELFVVGEHQRFVWHAHEVAAGAGWTAFSPMLLGECASMPSIARGPDGRLELFFVDPAGQVGRATQSTPGAWREPRARGTRLAASAHSS